MEEGTLVRWLKQPGETVSRGEAIAVIETDKVTMELESEYDGTLLEIVHRDGDVVPVTHTIAWVGAPGENIPADADGQRHPQPRLQPRPASPAEHAPGTTFRDGKIPATPAARAAAAAAGDPAGLGCGLGPLWCGPVERPRPGADDCSRGRKPACPGDIHPCFGHAPRNRRADAAQPPAGPVGHARHARGRHRARGPPLEDECRRRSESLLDRTSSCELPQRRCGSTPCSIPSSRGTGSS